jgi:thymidylate synthase (FAD)
MKVKLLNITPNAEEHIVEIARVSSSRKDKKANATGLLKYLVRHKHWSPFEHSHATFEIETSKAIGIQLIRHRSFSFQEFSQRYQNVNNLDEMFEPIELREQCEDNRQSSTEVINPNMIFRGDMHSAQDLIQIHLQTTKDLYSRLLAEGVAREQARMILPLTTTTKIQMTGSIRSWVHFLELRDDEYAQKEIQLIAKEIKQQLKTQLPTISEALWGEI